MMKMYFIFYYSNMNNKNISFKTTNYTFSLCSSFIEDTKFDIIHKDDPDLKYFICVCDT